MPRRVRLTAVNVPLDLIQCGNNQPGLLFSDEDYRFDLDWLTGYAGKTGRQIHAHVLIAW